MQRIYAFFGDHRGYVTLGVAVLLSVVMLSQDTLTRLHFARTVTSGLMSIGHRVFAWPLGLSNLRFENGVLREQNLRLSLELLRLREARLENTRLRELLLFRSSQDSDENFLAAKVVARNPARISNTILIDLGAGDGISARLPVVTADGLVGRVLEVHDHTSVVQLLLDRNCRVSAVVQRQSRSQGIVTCEEGVFRFMNVGVRSDIEIGDVVVSSGLGDVFPGGLYIGRVEFLGEAKQELFREVILTPGVNFGNLEEVFVLRDEIGQDPGP
jgi:rod shape-determining protein MreC